MTGEQQLAAQASAADRGQRRWHFARVILDERNHELLVNGAEIELERKPFEVLIYLLQHAGEVCTKDELLAGVWPGRILSETSLAKCIGRLREVLGDEDQNIIKTAFGFGYRFVAPVRVESAPTPELAHFDFRPGDHPFARPLWSLVERLGVGGHGEAWRARHEKTHEQRVFKFALDQDSLGALKREITLFRVINDTLGEDARVVKLLDWNLEQAPFFLEAEYIRGGSLVNWVQLRGGFAAIPLADRLEVIAQIAEALAAVHAVGVLHKDLKPSNVLVEPAADHKVDIRLADFGSGGVLDVKQLENLGITRLGFTKTVAEHDVASGTPLYLAPEILAGQPFTVKSDIYALGVILYQFLVGDFHRPMSPGWEREVSNEFLREDIAQAADGNLAARLGDAAELARRLRSLEERRQQREAERAALARAERVQRALERARARRLGISAAVVALVIGLVASTTLYLDARKARQKAEAEAQHAKSVSDFLGRDMLAAAASGDRSIKNLTVKELLDAASGQVDKRFADQPATAADLYAALGRSYLALDESGAALNHLDRALKLYQILGAPALESALLVGTDALPLTYLDGTMRGRIEGFDTLLKAGQASFGIAAPPVIKLQSALSSADVRLGHWTRGAKELSDLLKAMEQAGSADARMQARTRMSYGYVLEELARFPEAEQELRASTAQLASAYGERHLLVGLSRMWLGWLWAQTGRYAEAGPELTAALNIVDDWRNDNQSYVIAARDYQAKMQLMQGNAAAAAAWFAVSLTKVGALGDTIDQTFSAAEPLALSYQRLGRMEEAQAAMDKALGSATISLGAEHPWTLRIRIELADILRERRQLSQAWAELRPEGRMIKLEELPMEHPIRADLARVTGLLYQAQGEPDPARIALAEALRSDTQTFGASHWRAQRDRAELDQIGKGPPAIGPNKQAQPGE